MTTLLSADPVVSVICPTYNRSSRIIPTIHSVQAQSITGWELLVISDGCTDDTDDVVAACAARDDRVRLLRTGRHGHPSPVREVGIAQARGAVIAYLDHDDTWLPEHLEVLLGVLGAEGGARGAGAVGSAGGSGTAGGGGADIAAVGAVRVDPDGRRTSATGPLDLLWHPELQVVSPLFEPSRVAHRAGLSAAVGGWRQLDTGLEDWDLWLRLADAGHRITTIDARTAVLADGPATRRTRVPRRHLLRLAGFPDLAGAARGLAALREPAAAEALRAAARADQLAWYRDLAGAGTLHRPRSAPTGSGSTRSGPISPAAVADLVEQAFASLAPAASPWPDLTVRRNTAEQGGGVAVGLPLWCATPEHAARVEAILRDRQHTQLSLTSRVLSEDRHRHRRHGPAAPTRTTAGKQKNK
ncbi:glycosyltransferase family 2 protein [Parafrankia discariae]|uniref:glycosyltransferase family 2 protein n=1 Tax=Parafrankia discariae TaxID=365528 RepID=UPI0003695EA2|nr:glycosyltransferase family 2 protein [Parafrankia discariae]